MYQIKCGATLLYAMKNEQYAMTSPGMKCGDFSFHILPNSVAWSRYRSDLHGR